MYSVKRNIRKKDTKSPHFLDAGTSNIIAVMISIIGRTNEITFAAQEITGDRLIMALNLSNSISLVIPV
jgi:hypothetical protein